MNSLQVKQLLNCDARFICEVGCNPKPTIEWRFNGKKIEDGGQYKIKTNGNTRTLIVKKLTAKNAGQFTKQETLGNDREHPYITSAKGLGGWVKKMAVFANVQYCVYIDIVGGSEQVQKCADVIKEWSFSVNLVVELEITELI